MICKHILLLTLFNIPALFFPNSYMISSILSNIHSIYYSSFVYTQLNDSKYCHVAVKI